MMIVTAQQQRLIEQNAAALGISDRAMMENAGFRSAEYICRRYALEGKTVLVLCGNGGNGGDGFALARKLKQLGVSPVIALCCKTPTGKTASAMYSLAVSMAIPVIDAVEEEKRFGELLGQCEAVVDGIYGIGFREPMPEQVAAVIAKVNAADCIRIALDIPSGLQADGEAAAVNPFMAHLTLCFVAKKPAHIFKSTRQPCGETVYIGVGIPEQAYKIQGELREITPEYASSLLQRKSPLSHKGTFGRLLCLVGSDYFRGAAALCARGAVRSGAGIVEVASTEKVLSAVSAQLSEPILYDIFSNKIETFMHRITQATALVIGCGLEDTQDNQKLFELCMLSRSAPAVVDATALKFAAQSVDLLGSGKWPVIITPHLGEFSALTGLPVAGLAGIGGINAARDYAMSHGCFVVLKSENTLIASPRGELLVNTCGNPGLAKGGSGDLLAGMIGAFLAMGKEPMQAAVLGVYLQARAADIAVKSRNEYSVTPTDVSLCIGRAIDEMWAMGEGKDS